MCQSKTVISGKNAIIIMTFFGERRVGMKRNGKNAQEELISKFPYDTIKTWKKKYD